MHLVVLLASSALLALHTPVASHAFKLARHCRQGLASLLRLAPTAHTDPRHLQSTDVVPAKQTAEIRFSHLYILLHADTTSVTKDAHKQHVKAMTVYTG